MTVRLDFFVVKIRIHSISHFCRGADVLAKIYYYVRINLTGIREIAFE